MGYRNVWIELDSTCVHFLITHDMPRTHIHAPLISAIKNYLK